MKPHTVTVCAILLASTLFSCGASLQHEELTASDLVTAYERLIPTNQALQQGRWAIDPGDYPKVLGNYESRQVKEVFICGDVCPQYGSVILVYSGTTEADCDAASGDVIYSHFWGPQFQGCSPLTIRDGTLAQSGASSWSIVGERITSTAQSFNTPLLFDSASRCRKNGAQVACGGFAPGQSAKVVGVKSGDAILVLTLDI